jgi:hypothetical protein
MTERTYLVGLPVAVTVYDGRVHLAVDAAEVTSAIQRTADPRFGRRDYDGDNDVTDEEREHDARAVAAAFTALVQGGQPWRITTSTMQHERRHRTLWRARRRCRR